MGLDPQNQNTPISLGLTYQGKWDHIFIAVLLNRSKNVLQNRCWNLFLIKSQAFSRWLPLLIIFFELFKCAAIKIWAHLIQESTPYTRIKRLGTVLLPISTYSFNFKTLKILMLIIQVCKWQNVHFDQMKYTNNIFMMENYL